jgi:hypothetical protein
MPEEREKTRAALAARVIPALRERGFRGSFPHFRRVGPTKTDLLSVQFDKQGGGFVIELGGGPPDRFRTAWGKEIPAAELRAFDLSPRARARLVSGAGGSTASWFRYAAGEVGDRVDRFDSAAERVLALLPQADAWWGGERAGRNIRTY